MPLDARMIAFFSAIERSPLSFWMRDDAYAYFIALIFHAFGMALLVGGGIVISLGVLGFAGAVEVPRLRGFVPVMWVGAVLAIVSGFLLLVAYPAKALTNPLFAVKFACLLGAALLQNAALARASAANARRRARLLAALALALWFCGVAAGKILLHTARVLTVS